MYAEVDQPKAYPKVLAGTFFFIVFILASGTGIFGYLAFGSTVKQTLLFNLPSTDPGSIVAKYIYIIAIMGIFVLVIYPIFNVFESAKWYRKLAIKE